ncbi:hypothetical protein TRVL_01375 [Trypanosoma vivax]|nr:hypothetical protein TRVL_01375 [Trypanosoma vivax]
MFPHDRLSAGCARAFPPNRALPSGKLWGITRASAFILCSNERNSRGLWLPLLRHALSNGYVSALFLFVTCKLPPQFIVWVSVRRCVPSTAPFPPPKRTVGPFVQLF